MIKKKRKIIKNKSMKLMEIEISKKLFSFSAIFHDIWLMTLCTVIR